MGTYQKISYFWNLRNHLISLTPFESFLVLTFITIVIIVSPTYKKSPGRFAVKKTTTEKEPLQLRIIKEVP